MTLQSMNRMRIIRQFFCFAGVGVFGTASHYLVLVVLVQLASANPVTASVCGFIIGACVNYILNYLWTFRSRQPHAEAMIRFFAIAFSGLLLNAAIMAMATEFFYFHYLPSQLIATAVVLFWNFTGSRVWAFRQGTP